MARPPGAVQLHVVAYHRHRQHQQRLLRQSVAGQSDQRRVEPRQLQPGYAVELDQQLYLPGPLVQGKGQADGRDGRRLAVEQHHHRQKGNPFSIGQWNTDPGVGMWNNRADFVSGVAPNMGKGSRSDWANPNRATSTRPPSPFPSPVTTKRRDGAVSATRAGTPTGDRASLASIHRS